jgi:tetratricopeptide (TPR) repeat protein
VHQAPTQLISPSTVADLAEAKAQALAAQNQTTLRAADLAEQAALAANQGRLTDARRDLDAALADTVDLRVLFLGFQFYFRTAIAEGVGTADKAVGLDRAEHLVRQRLDLAAAAGDSASAARAHTNLGLTLHYKGELESAEHHYLQAVEIDRRLNHEFGLARDLGNLGNFYETRAEPVTPADLERAEALYNEALAIAMRIGADELTAGKLANLGDIAAHRGRLEEARRLWNQALDLAQTHAIDKVADYCRTRLASHAAP